MGTIVGGDPTDGMTRRNIQITQADFAQGPASEAESLDIGQIDELGRAEVGDDGQFASYELVQPGQPLGETGLSAKGKAYVELRDGEGELVDDSAEIRLIGRPINADHRDELSGWKKHRDLRVEEPDKRMEWPPSKGRDPSSGSLVDKIVRHGRVIAIEVRHPSKSIDIDLSNCDIAIPGRAWY